MTSILSLYSINTYGPQYFFQYLSIRVYSYEYCIVYTVAYMEYAFKMNMCYNIDYLYLHLQCVLINVQNSFILLPTRVIIFTQYQRL